MRLRRCLLSSVPSVDAVCLRWWSGQAADAIHNVPSQQPMSPGVKVEGGVAVKQESGAPNSKVQAVSAVKLEPVFDVKQERGVASSSAALVKPEPAVKCEKDSGDGGGPRARGSGGAAAGAVASTSLRHRLLTFATDLSATCDVQDVAAVVTALTAVSPRALATSHICKVWCRGAWRVVT